jgi:hypothetical protein
MLYILLTVRPHCTSAAVHTTALILLLQVLCAAAVLSIFVHGRADVRDQIVVIASSPSLPPQPLHDLLLHAVHVTECAAEGAGDHNVVVHTHRMRQHENAADAGRRAEALDVRRLSEEKDATDTAEPQPACVSYQHYSSTTSRRSRGFSEQQMYCDIPSRQFSATSCSFAAAHQRTASSMASVSLTRSLSVCSVTLVITTGSRYVEMLALTEVPPPTSVTGTLGLSLLLELFNNTVVNYTEPNLGSTTFEHRPAVLTYDVQQRTYTSLIADGCISCTYANCNNHADYIDGYKPNCICSCWYLNRHQHQHQHHHHRRHRHQHLHH